MRKRAALALIALTSFLALGLAAARMAAPEPADGTQEFLQRRDALRLKFTGKALVYSGKDDRDFDKNFFYLVGKREPEAALLMAPGAGNDILFLKSIEDAGRLAAWKAASGIQQIWPLSELDSILDTFHAWETRLNFPQPPTDPAYDQRRIFTRPSWLVIRNTRFSTWCLSWPKCA